VASLGPTVEHKDVVVALLGVSAGLAGLVLVFLGLVITTFRSFQAPTPAAVLDPFRRATGMVLAAFAIGIACVVVASIWLVRLGENQGLYVATVVLFGAQIAALLVATGSTVFRLVWKR
jgi:hypothetical protein